MKNLAVIEESDIKPKPTKSDVRRAMARAIREQQIEARNADEKQKSYDRKALNVKAVALLKRRGKWAETVDCPSWSGGQLQVAVTLDKSDPDALHLITSLRECDKRSSIVVQDEADIIRDLIEGERCATGSPVEKLLADPNIKKALLETGTKLVGNVQKQKAITV